MALIDNGNPVTAEDHKKFWEDTLKNTRAILFNLDKAIYALTNEEMKSYNMNTGSNIVSVTLQDVPSLIDRRGALIKQIESLEENLGINRQPQIFQGVPSW